MSSQWVQFLPCQVRKALFDMLQAFEGGDPAFLEGTRWLDLFAGTGSIGLEALSRGATHCQFIELDSWVVQSVLGPNIESCSGDGSTMIHTGVTPLLNAAPPSRCSLWCM